MNGIMPTINREQYINALKLAFMTNENIIVVGQPGEGKTQIAEQILNELTPYVYTGTPAVEDATTPAGMPVRTTHPDTGETDVAFLPFKLMRALVNHDPNGPTAAVILDDFGQAPHDVQAAYMQVLQDHRVGEQSFPDNVCFVILTNDRSHKSAVKPLLEAVKSRALSIYKYSLDVEEWIEWAYQNNLYHSIPAFLRFKPEAFNDFRPTTEMVNQPCPRTWHKLSKALYTIDENKMHNVRYPTIIGSVAHFGPEYAEFEKYYERIPDIDAIISGEEEFAHDPIDPSLTYALCGMLVHAARNPETNIKRIIKVAKSLPQPFQIALSKDLRSAAPDIIETDAFTDWCVSLISVFDI